MPPSGNCGPNRFGGSNCLLLLVELVSTSLSSVSSSFGLSALFISSSFFDKKLENLSINELKSCSTPCAATVSFFATSPAHSLSFVTAQ